MAKYACKFGTVKMCGKSIQQNAENIKEAVGNYSSKIEGDLSSWKSSSKESFIVVNEKQSKDANNLSTYANDLGRFVEEAAKKIEDLENELAQFKI